ncbi:MAG TPA: Gfo/Idh/MocA family oxidoreductase [Terriglobia bacterium]|jgi:predicted dehydrogenase|nr:Gfo/Idh/MocA family oxidoreductase [Terriglobia bacterium]
MEADLSRRDFLKTAAKTTAGLSAAAGITFLTHPERVFGANDRVRVAVCGLHGRGKDHISAFSHLSNVEIAAVCDVDENVLQKRIGEVGGKPQSYVDVRKLLQDKSIDAISIATPNHWHSLMAIWACQAGKDVYVEKPCSHNLWEGRQLVLAADKYQRIVQHGTQIRSSPAIQEAVKGLHEGAIGDVYLARGLCFKWRDMIGRTPQEPVPAGVDYDLWTGPAPLKPFTRNRFHYNWHWFWDTGNGDLGNQGVHQLDVARWGLGVSFPNRISAIGGHFMLDDDQQTPNTLACAFEFDLPDGKRKMMEFEVRHWITNDEATVGRGDLVAGKHRFFGHHNAIGNIFYGSNGYLATGDEDAVSYETWLGKDEKSGPHAHGGGDHFGNFVDCVRSRKKEDLNAPVKEGYVSASLVHLANVSYRLGRSLQFDPATEQVIDDDEASRLLRDGDRGYRTPFDVPKEV